MIDTIIYHGSCADGWCAAYVAQQQYPGAQLVSATHGQPIDDAVVAGKRVLVLDFSWKRAETERIAVLASWIRILDHHKTAEAELAGLTYATFDMNRSGAQLAYDYFHAGSILVETKRPWYIDYVADRDLWRFALPDSKAINAYLMTLPHTIAEWNKVDAYAALDLDISTIVTRGKGALAQINHYVRGVCDEARPGRWQGPERIFRLLVVNAPYLNTSEVAHELCQRDADVGVGWFIRGDGQMQFSLRSIGDLDVSALARLYGGGGHKNAAGFQLTAAQGWALLASWGVTSL